jgi:hypothetical protein
MNPRRKKCSSTTAHEFHAVIPEKIANAKLCTATNAHKYLSWGRNPMAFRNDSNGFLESIYMTSIPKTASGRKKKDTTEPLLDNTGKR